MNELPFFDVDVRVCGGPGLGPFPDVPELLSEMDYYGVEKALVQHGNIAGGGAVLTNDELAEALQADTEHRLLGVWCLLPSQCDEIPAPDELFRQMKEKRIAALTLYPGDHRFEPCRMTLGKVMDAAAERRIPVLLKGFSEKWPEIYRFVETFPDNIMIHCDNWGKWGHDRQVRPLLENFPNFYYALSGYWVMGGIRDLVERYGSRRILYGSGFPFYSQGSGMLQLRYSGMDSETVADIAGRNLERLMKEVQL